MKVSAKDVKALREKTGAGMMDCKKALVENEGDFDAAVEWLQTKLRIKTEKKADRVAAQGLVRTWVSKDRKEGVIVEVNAETDFVARNDQFISFVDSVTEAVAASDVTSIEQARETLTLGGKPLPEYTKDAIVSIGEKIEVRRIARLEIEGEGAIVDYLHQGDQIGVLVKITGNTGDEVTEFGRDVTMQVASMRPNYLSSEDVDESEAQQQEKIFHAQLLDEGKPENIIPRIMEGKMKKWRSENSLLDQAFVKDTDLTVRQYQDKIGGISLDDFVRFEVGEGIEREESNLAEEVAAQLKG